MDIRRTLAGDLYLALTEVDSASKLINLTIFIKPLINWIWIGSGVDGAGNGAGARGRSRTQADRSRRRYEARTMMYLKWILLLVCVALALWPLLAKREDQRQRKGSTRDGSGHSQRFWRLS